MPYGNSQHARRAAAKKHAQKVHKCQCGREINGNAYYIHKAKCQKRE